ncbi:MAG: response regulator [Alphaproteobacteria bacterium]|nr:MAG: response regulator [Alphaproteobacteria bacterium]
MKRFLRDVLTPGSAGAYGRAEWALHWLLAAAIILPLAIFSAAATISYRENQIEAGDRLQRNLATVYEHALKVLETVELASRYLDEMLNDTSDPDMRANEADFHRRLKSLTDILPQFADIWIVDAGGHPVVAGTVFPIARELDLSDRDYFRAHRNNEVEGLYVGNVITARATNQRGQPRFFGLSRKRIGVDGKFGGVTVISISPDYFREYYATLTQPIVAALVRGDGTVLARYPELPQTVTRLTQGNDLAVQIGERRDAGTLTSRSGVDGKERAYAFRKLPRVDLYVTTGVDTAAITEAWMLGMSRHLIFGLPATAALIALVLMALTRTRREAEANRLLREEIARREATEEKLRQAQKMEAVGRLTGGIAHDFNNLLTAIMGNLDLALRRLDGPERVRGWLANCRQASERAATLVQRLLAFSRQHPLQVRSVDTNRLVQGMSELLSRSIGETVTIETVLAGGLWNAAVDPNQLENAIVNLAVNARDAMPTGGQLTIETANCHLDEHYVETAGEDIAPGQYVMVAVSDSGGGMTREVMSRAFEPFFTTKPTGVGTGLGLSQVYGFVKQSGGHIRIYSELGQGTTIKLYFPRLSARADVPPWTPREPAPAAAPAQGTETVLVVEDDAQVNQLAVEALTERGYRVLSASDGGSALRLAADAAQLDLLLTDVVLPGGMNGRELADQMRQRRADIKILYMTGYTRNAIIHHGRLDPDIDLLTKPFTADALTRKVRRVLDVNGASSSVPSPLVGEG